MFRMLSTVSFPMLLTQLFSASHVSAEALDATTSVYPREVLYAELPAEIVKDNEQFKNIDDDGQLRHPVKGHEIEKANKKRDEKQLQEGKKSQTKHQSEEQPGEKSMNQQMNGDAGVHR